MIDEIRQVPIEDLIPYARNARTHSDEQVAQIAASIREFGFNNPVLLRCDNTIIAGHGRVMAARKLGLDTVPAVYLSHLSDTQARAYVIADNKLALNAGWDDELLRVEFLDLLEDDFDLNLTGFGEDEIGSLNFEDGVETEMPDLASGDRAPFQQMAFTLHDMQAEQVKAALKKAKEVGPFENCENDNSNGNALARVCEAYNGVG